jgi:hypothetical protein
MRDTSDGYQVPPVSEVRKPQSRGGQSAQVTALRHKRIGDYLIEAGLLTQSQIDVALNDQQMTQMKFGEILAARGWVKQQTVDFVMEKVVIPERRVIEQRERARRMQAAAQAAATVQAAPKQAEAQVVAKPPAADLRPAAAQPAPAAGAALNGQGFVRRDVPISKPLPPVKSSDGDVNWVG